MKLRHLLAIAPAVLLCATLWASSGKAAAPTPAATDSALQEQRAYLYNTANWVFAQASDLYRDIANSDPEQVGPVTTISARIFLGYNLSALHRFAAADAAMSEAEAMLGAAEGTLSPIDERTLRVNLLVGRAVLVGNRGSDPTTAPAERDAAFRQAADLAAQAASLAAAPLSAGAAGRLPSATQQGDVIVLSPQQTQAFNYSRGAALGDLAPRPMSIQEKLAVLGARAHYARAAALLSMGDQSGAAQSNAAAQQALAPLEPDVVAWLRALVADQKAELQIRAGDVAGAETTLQQAFHVLERSHGLSRPAAYLLRRRAVLQLQRGDMTGARASQEQSFAILLQQTDGQQPTREEVAPYQSMLAPAAVSGDTEDISKFFEVSSVAAERATAKAIANVAERLASGDNAIAQALRDLQSARLKLERATARMTRIQESLGTDQPATPEQVKSAEEAQKAARQQVVDATDECIRIAGSKAAAATSPKSELGAIQAQLRGEEAYVRFVFLSDGSGYAILISKNHARVVRTGITEEDAARKVAELRGSATVTGAGVLPGFKLTRSAELYQALFGGLQDDLVGIRHLVIEPAGPLFSLPFAALLVRPADAALKAQFIASRGTNYSGAPWLGREKTIELSVGSAAFVRLRQVRASAATRPFFAFADPTPAPNNMAAAVQVGALRQSRGVSVVPVSATSSGTACLAEARGILSFEALPDSLTEAQSAARSFGAAAEGAVVSGAQFTDEAVKARDDLKAYRVLLFATHAALPNQAQCWPDPFLITTKGPGLQSDGVLETTEVAGLELDANLVVLSACNTGAADLDALAAGDASGQALGGLAQSFFFAGTRGVLVSHWEVNSRATAELITGLLAANAQGASAVEALATAEQRLKDDPRRSHPYYWAAFTLVGGVVQ